MDSEREYWSSEHEPELEMALRISREEYEQSRRASTSTLAASCGSSSRLASQSSSSHARSSIARQADLEQRVLAVDAEISECENRLARMQARRTALLQELAQLRTQIPQNVPPPVSRKGKGRERRINYFDRFDRTEELIECARAKFGIQKFRLCQEGVCNANLAQRDIVCVMPTGGGKSLTYQLPASMTPGCTIVVSPLISLMTDQVLHLEEYGVSAVMLSSALHYEELQAIQSQMHAMASEQCNARDEIKLCYVTPEKLGKDKRFWSLLHKLYEAEKLARFVIDEAHCVSEMGHDYRPDYKALGKLRRVFPKVPILALSATCPPKVLQDLSNTLGLQYPPKRGTEADAEGTVYFSAPLYRKNLHYSVLPKPDSFADVIKVTREFILEKHANQSGIIYCLSKKDAEHVAKELSSESKGQIKTGIYHADIPDAKKAKLHKEWRDGRVNVVCATIAFGLGIDKADVRFVIHHSLPKSVEGLYQESGRAGRDGKDADCVLLYNPRDADRLYTLTALDQQSPAKLVNILRFVQDFEECRKVFFAQYFSVSSQLSVEEWTTTETAALDRCGHCDNCTRAPGSVSRIDLRLPAWQTLKAAEAVEGHGSRLTLRQLGGIVRGLGHGKVTVSKTRRRRAEQSATIDMEEIAGGKVLLAKEDTEMLCIYLLINDYLKEEYVPNKHKINTYLVPGANARLLTTLTRAEIVDAGKGPKLECAFPVTRKRKAAAKSTSALKDVAQQVAAQPKRKRPPASSSFVQDDSGYADAALGERADVDVDDVPYARSRRGSGQNGVRNLRRGDGTRHGRESPIVIDDSDEDDIGGAQDDEDVEREMYAVEGDVEDESGGDDDWSFSLRNDRPNKRTRLQQRPSVARPARRAPVEDDVISIDSD